MPCLHAALLDCERAAVDDLIRNPMGLSSSRGAAGEGPPPAHEKDGAFVLLQRLRILPKNDGYAYVSDLDAFFSSLYNYYYMRGLGAIVGKGLVELVSLFFTLWLSLVLFAYIDWGALSQCNDEKTCHESFIEAYVVPSPFSSGEGRWLRNAWIITYCLLFSVYGLFCLVQYGHAVIASMESKLFLEEILAVSDKDLEMGRVEWEDIVERMSEAQRVGKCRVAILPGPAPVRTATEASLSPSHSSAIQQDADADADGPTGHLVVAQRIMRRENYLIAFFNQGLLDLTVPAMPWSRSSRTRAPRGDKKAFFSKSIEWSLYFCVLNYMFNHSRKIRPAFYSDPSSLRRRFRLCGVAHAIFMPFLLFFVTLHFFMSNVYDWQSTKEYLGPREWSPMARWLFREFNELPHSFERRLEPSYKSAAAYLDMFGRASPLKVAFGRLLVFVSGSLGTFLIALAAMNDAILLHVKIGQWNLLWYAGVLGVCFSVGKGLIPKATCPHFGHARRNLIKDMNREIENLATHTHYLPDEWRGRGWHDNTKKAFASLFQFKANHFANEIAAIVAAPLILCVSLPRCADKLCNFVRDSKVEVSGVGDMVGYSTFDFESFQDESWMGSKTSSCDSFKSGFGHRPKSRHGKMEMSFFNFKGSYPNWAMPPSGKKLADRVETFRHQQDIALARERSLHIEAARAQLETLRLLELEREKKATAGLVRFVDHHHQLVSPGPDSGGGGTQGGNVSQHRKEASAELECLGLPPNNALHLPSVHFEDSTHSFAPPPHIFSHSLLHHVDMTNNGPEAPGSTNMHYADAGLSTELRGLLDGSLVGSFTGSLVPIEDSSPNIRADQQYNLLDHYHSKCVDGGNNDRITARREGDGTT